MLPTKFLKDPDVMALSCGDVRLILIGLVLNADDEGRELAHAKLLGRELDYPPEVIEQALQELEANDLILLYEVGKYRYYSLTRWYEWQTLNKPTRSKYPAPPSEHAPEGTHQEPSEAVTTPSQRFQDFPGESGKILENSEKPRKTPLEVEVEVEEEGEEKRTESEEEEEEESNVIPFPPSATRTDGDRPPEKDDQQYRITQTSAQVAEILKLAVTPPLTRLVAEFLSDPGLSLPGEADAAREWIDDPARNRKRQRMTPAFFRRWLKRERETVARRQAEWQQSQEAKANGTPPARASGATARATHRSLMGLEQEYRAACSTPVQASERKERGES
jgi:DNA-binding transcriptional ArsR family regulator